MDYSRYSFSASELRFDRGEMNMRHTPMEVIDNRQKMVCEKYSADFLRSPLDLKIGISRKVNNSTEVLNGLRHPPEGDTTGWYIWGDEDLSEDSDFFVPICVEHLHEYCEAAMKYLGLAPGWRFLIGKNGYEDVWYDEHLLNLM